MKSIETANNYYYIFTIIDKFCLSIYRGRFNNYCYATYVIFQSEFFLSGYCIFKGYIYDKILPGKKDRRPPSAVNLGELILECFLEVVNTLNFAKAAERLNVSQPTVTNQIKSL